MSARDPNNTEYSKIIQDHNSCRCAQIESQVTTATITGREGPAITLTCQVKPCDLEDSPSQVTIHIVRRLTLFTWFHDEVGVIFLVFKGKKWGFRSGCMPWIATCSRLHFKRNQQFHAGRGSRKPWTLLDTFGICVMYRSVNQKLSPKCPKMPKSWAIASPPAIPGRRAAVDALGLGKGPAGRPPRIEHQIRGQVPKIGYSVQHWGWLGDASHPKQDSSSGTPLTIRDTNGKCKTIKKTTTRSKTKKKWSQKTLRANPLDSVELARNV